MSTSFEHSIAYLFAAGLDAEAARYRVLAYVQDIRSRYAEKKLYPYLDDLRDRCRTMRGLLTRSDELAQALASPVIGFDARTGKLLREQLPKPQPIAELEGILHTALPRLERLFSEGTELRNDLSARIRLEPVGLMPLRVSEGYLLLQQGNEARAYAYQQVVPPPISADMPAVRTRYVASYTLSLVSTIQQVKADLVRSLTELPNPAVFAFTADVTLPTVETFMPLAKRMVYEVIANASSRLGEA